MSQFKIVYVNRDDYGKIEFVLHNPDMDNSPIGSKVKLTAEVITNARVKRLISDDYGYSMDDFKTRKVPYLLIMPPKSDSIAIYYGDDIADVLVRLYESNSIVDEDEYVDEYEYD